MTKAHLNHSYRLPTLENRLHRRFGISLLATVLGATLGSGCTDDAEGDTDTDTDSAGTDPTSTMSTTAPSGTSSTTGPTTSSTSSSGTDPSTSTTSTTSTTTDAESSGSEGSSSTGEPPAGLCVGVDLAGYAATVHSMTGPPAGPCVTEPAPCGGDLLGTWDIEDECGFDELPNIFGETCPDAVQVVNATTTVGTRTFVDDGTFAFDFLRVIDLETTFDAMDCFATDCAGMETLLDGEDGITAVCEDQAGECTCLVELDSGGMVSGTYSTIMDDFVEFTVDGDSTGPQPFCVADGRFDLWSPQYALTEYEIGCDIDDECIDALGNASEFYICSVPEEK